MTIISERCIPSCLYLTARTIKPEIIRTLPFHQIMQLYEVKMVHNSYVRRCSIIIFFPASFNLLQTKCNYIWHSTLTLPAKMTEIFNRSVRILVPQFLDLGLGGDLNLPICSSSRKKRKRKELDWAGGAWSKFAIWCCGMIQ